MLQRIPFFAFLIAVYPVLFLYTHNISYITTQEFLLCFLAASGIFAIGFLITRAFVKNNLKTGCLLALGFFLLIIYGPVSNLIYLLLVISGLKFPFSDELVLLLFLLVFIRGTRKILRKEPGPSGVALLNWFSLALVALCVFNLFSDEIEDLQYSSAVSTGITTRYQSLKDSSSSEVSNPPDIYYVILDAYGRGDVIKELFKQETSPFLDSLKSKGFYVAESSQSNYMQTFFSLSSTLNLGYLDDLIAQVDRKSVNRGVLQRILRENVVFHRAKDLGYQVTTIATGFDTTGTTNVDRRIKDPFLNPLAGGLLTNLHIPWIRESISRFLHQAHQRRILFGFESLKTIGREAGPQFVFAHILSPHPPFVFQADGSFRFTGRDFALADGDDFGAREEYKEGYRAQVTFVDSQLTQVVEAILSNKNKKSIIILQGDHGPGSELVWDSLKESNLKERFSILNAYYFPDSNYQALTPDVTPVNTFRIIANQFWNAKLPLLENRQYFSSTHRPFALTEVTGKTN